MELEADGSYTLGIRRGALDTVAQTITTATPTCYAVRFNSLVAMQLAIRSPLAIGETVTVKVYSVIGRTGSADSEDTKELTCVYRNRANRPWRPLADTGDWPGTWNSGTASLIVTWAEAYRFGDIPNDWDGPVWTVDARLPGDPFDITDPEAGSRYVGEETPHATSHTINAATLATALGGRQTFVLRLYTRDTKTGLRSPLVGTEDCQLRMRTLSDVANLPSAVQAVQANFSKVDCYLACRTPFEYGAVGDGITDDTLAIQTAINAGNGYLFLPSGVTFIVENLSIQNHNYPNRIFRIFGGGCLKLKANASHVLLYIYNCDNLTIDGVEFDGNRDNQTGSNWGIYCVRMNYSSIQNCFLHDHSGTALVLDKDVSGGTGLCDENEISRNRIILNDGHGVYIQNCGDHGLANNHIGWNAWDGVQCVGCYTITLVGNHILSNTQNGVKISGSGRFVLDGNQIRENKRHGVVMSGAAGHKLTANRMIWNGVEAENTYDGCEPHQTALRP